MTVIDLTVAASKADLATLETSLAREIAAMKASLIKWYVGTMFALACLVVSLVKFAHW
jgi:hypothetical protein